MMVVVVTAVTLHFYPLYRDRITYIKSDAEIGVPLILERRGKKVNGRDVLGSQKLTSIG